MGRVPGRLGTGHGTDSTHNIARIYRVWDGGTAPAPCGYPPPDLGPPHRSPRRSFRAKASPLSLSTSRFLSTIHAQNLPCLVNHIGPAFARKLRRGDR